MRINIPMSQRLEEMTISILNEKKISFEEDPDLGDEDYFVDLVVSLEKDTYIIRFKGYDPLLPNISDMKTCVEKYKEKFKIDTIPVIIFLGTPVSYVENFADELGIILFGIKKKRKIKGMLEQFLDEPNHSLIKSVSI